MKSIRPPAPRGVPAFGTAVYFEGSTENCKSDTTGS